MRSRPLSLLSALILLAMLAACGGGDAATDDSSAGDSSSQRRFLSLGTAPPGGAFFVVGSALAEVAGAAQPGWEITAEATKGSQENIRRLASGELDFALSNAAISYFAVRGEASWDQQFPIQAVMTLAPNIALFVTQADSGIESLADLRDRRVVIGPAGAGFEMFVTPILEAHGLAWDDLEVLHGTQTAAVDMLSDGSADAAFLGGAVPTASITQASTSMDLRFVPFDEDARQQLANDFPFFALASVPAGTYRNQDSEFAGLNVGSMHLITRADQEQSVVESFTRNLWQNREQVVARHAAGKAIRDTIVIRDTGTPFHPGAEAVYRELGLWPDAAAESGPGDAESPGDAEGNGGADSAAPAADEDESATGS